MGAGPVGAAPVQAGRVWRVMVLVGVLAFVAAAAGILVPAAHTTRTTADEPQYLLTAISLAEDQDLDIADELADGRWSRSTRWRCPSRPSGWRTGVG